MATELIERIERQVDNHEKRIDTLERNEGTLTERLQHVCDDLKDLTTSIRDDMKFRRRTLVGGIVTVIVSLIVWVFTH